LTAERVALAKSNLDRLLGAALVAEIEAIGTEAASIAGDAKGTGRSAIAAWARCAAAWREAERPYEAAHARLREARAAFACGDRDRARAALHEAADVADALGAVSVRILVDDLARRARVAAQAPRRTNPDPEELTPRELEVLRLLADGLTNRGIAERLFLSRKTVGIHVSRILEKLRAHTRGEAAAVARKRGLLE
jgi:DNA-binding NarL/FixJ family response regulator